MEFWIAIRISNQSFSHACPSAPHSFFGFSGFCQCSLHMRCQKSNFLLYRSVSWQYNDNEQSCQPATQPKKASRRKGVAAEDRRSMKREAESVSVRHGAVAEPEKTLSNEKKWRSVGVTKMKHKIMLASSENHSKFSELIHLVWIWWNYFLVSELAYTLYTHRRARETYTHAGYIIVTMASRLFYTDIICDSINSLSIPFSLPLLLHEC